MQLRVIPFAEPMRPVRTARTVMTERRGWYIALENNARTGIGEVAPWPGFGAGQAACEHALGDLSQTHFAAWLNGAPLPSASDSVDERGREKARRALFAFDQINDSLPVEVASALKFALLDLWAQHFGVSLAEMLLSDEKPLDAIAVHARVDSASAAQLAVGRGATALKVKVGRLPLGDEGARIMAIRAAVGPDVAMHLDANGAYPVPVACQAARLFAAATPKWLEEPVARDDVLGLAEVRRTKALPIYADESVTSLSQAEVLFRAEAIDGIVIKPSFVGGALKAVALGHWAHSHALGVCVTDALETRVGRMGALHVALALRLDNACGLGGAGMDEGEGPYKAQNFRLYRPKISGLGLSFDERAALCGQTNTEGVAGSLATAHRGGRL